MCYSRGLITDWLAKLHNLYLMFFSLEAPKISPFAFDGDLKEGDRSQVMYFTYTCTLYKANPKLSSAL